VITQKVKRISRLVGSQIPKTTVLASFLSLSIGLVAGVLVSVFAIQWNLSQLAEHDISELRMNIVTLESNYMEDLDEQVTEIEKQINALPPQQKAPFEVSLSRLRSSIDSLPKITTFQAAQLRKELIALERDRRSLFLSTISTIAQSLGGFLFLLTAFFAWRNLRAAEKTIYLAEEKQNKEQLVDSVKMLKDDDVKIRLLGITSLEKIANNAPNYRWDTISSLASFVQAKKRINPCIDDDIQSALRIISAPTLIRSDKQVIDLSYKNLRGAKLRNGNLSRTLFTCSDLTDADLQGFQFDDSIFEEAILINAKLDRANLRRADLSRGNLTNVSLENADMSLAILDKAILDSANLRKSILERASLNKTSLKNTKMYRVNLRGATLFKSELVNVDLESADLSPSNLSERTSGGTIFECDLQRANLSKAKLKRANLTHADMKNTILKDADLEGAILRDANLADAVLDGANLSGAILVNAIISKSSLKNVKGTTEDQLNQAIIINS